MRIIQLHKMKASVPQKLSECTHSQIVAIGYVFARQFNRYEARVYLASQWAGKLYRYNEVMCKTLTTLARKSRKKKLDIAHSRKLEDMKFETESNRHHLAMLTDWFDEEHLTDRWIMPRLQLRKNLLRRRVVFGPALRLGNVEFWEWCKAETFFARYCKSGSREDFNLFAACIFRPAQSNGQRIPFNDDSRALQNSAAWFNSLSEAEVLAIRINYIAIKRWLAQVFPNVFKSSGEESEGAETDYTELLLRAAKAQSMDEVIVSKKPVLVELKKLELSARDYNEVKAKQE